MTCKIRKQFYIEPRQAEMLKYFCESTGQSETEVIRQAIDEFIQKNRSKRPVMRDPQAWEKARRFIDELIAKGPVPGGRTWRREDLYGR